MSDAEKDVENTSDLQENSNSNSFNNNCLDMNNEENINPEVYKVPPGKTSSFVTILSIWNTMIGSSTVTMPNCVAKAGLIPTVLFNLLFATVCFYTCRVVVKTGGKDNDYADTVNRYFGKKYGYTGRVLQILFNLSINVGATFIYFLTINQNLYPCLALLLKACGLNINPDEMEPKFSEFSIIYCGILLSVIAFPLFIMKEMGIIIKINSFGIYFVSILLVFVMYTGVSSLFTTKFVFDYIKNTASEPRYLYLFGSDPSILMGTLSLGYFSHSFVLPVMKNNANQQNNKRDLFIGYIFVMTTYIVVGSLGYIGFSGKNFGEEFKDNWFRFFKSDDILIIILRLINVIQLMSILPVLFYIVRIQFYGTFWHNDYPGKFHVICFSAILSLLCLIVLYFFYNSLGKMLGIVGASTGLFLIYIIPLVVNIVYYDRKHPENLEELQKTLKKGINEEEQSTEIKEKDIDDYGISVKPRNKTKDIFFYISQYILMIFGVFTLVIQFVSINLFGIHIKDKAII